MATDAAFLVPPLLRVEALLLDDGGVTIRAVSEATDIRCPVCGEPSDRVHSRYLRTLADLPWARFAVRLRVQVRKFFCANPSCPRTVFAERLDGVAAALRDQAKADGQPRSPPDEVYQGKRRHPRPERWRERQAEAAAEGVARRHAKGATVAAIARTVGISRMTVYKYLREGPPQRKRHTVHGRPRVLAPWEPYLLRRWDEGCHTATVLWREIQGQGFAHSVTNVQRFVAQLRREGPSPAGRPRTALTKPEGPPPRQVASLVLRRPERRTEEQRTYLSHLCGADAAIATALALAEDFLLMLRRREGERLPAWLERAEASGVGDLARFATKLRGDHGAVQAGLTLRWSNGQTEGQVNRLKLVKRQAYGRAKVDLLRQRVLQAA